MSDDMQQFRKEYSEDGLDISDMHTSPFNQFQDWFSTAAATGMQEPNGMVLSTVDETGRPSGRVVLLKAWDHRGFVFYTNYESRKALAMKANPVASLTFWWGQFDRQIRIEGRIEKASAEESDAYYHSRPRGSQLGAWTSPQSQKLENRDALQSLYQETEERFAEDEIIPRPEFWGGYRLVPDRFEFWQGRKSRLHDRLTYDLSSDGTWDMSRLAP
ncbi:MAG: pyridoxamine 5'-phosphate oxidase [Chloroflexota bacterium]